MKMQAFVSHISEEVAVATCLKTVLTRDFLGLLNVFVSSDGESIAAGEDWLRSIEHALQESAMLIILCSPASVKRPWINFEAGAAWVRSIPLVPLCHCGLLPDDLPVPLSLRQGVALRHAEGLHRLYRRIAEVLKCDVPARCFEMLALELGRSSPPDGEILPTALTRERAIRKRLKEALEHQHFRWRTIERLAAEAAVSQEVVADLLRGDQEVRFSRGKTGQIVVGLRSRTDSSGKANDK